MEIKRIEIFENTDYMIRKKDITNIMGNCERKREGAHDKWKYFKKTFAIDTGKV